MQTADNLSFNEVWSLPDEAWLPPKPTALMINLSVSRLAQLRSLGGGPPYSKRGNLIRYNVGKTKLWLGEGRIE